jgi:hypothetical protein
MVKAKIKPKKWIGYLSGKGPKLGVTSTLRESPIMVFDKTIRKD